MQNILLDCRIDLPVSALLQNEFDFNAKFLLQMQMFTAFAY